MSVPTPSNTPTVANSVLRGNFVMLRADTLWLVLPQQDLQSTDYLQQKPVEFDAGAGLLHIPDAQDGAVYVAISSDMRLLPSCPPDRFVSTRLQGVDVCWCWSEVRMLVDVELSPEALPADLLTPLTPVREIVAVGDIWAFMCSADALEQFVLAQVGEEA